MIKAKAQFVEGSTAIAHTIFNIRPDLVSAYPITPQTHIVEHLASLKTQGKASYEYIKAESEFAAASILIGASAAGGRTYSASSSQGVLLMMEALYNSAGLRLPIVLTIANRSVSAPINIFNDHSDAMSMKDAGWLMFFAENHQEAVDYHVLAYKIAEETELPVAVNVDGFIITHSYKSVYIPDSKTISSYLPKYTPALDTYLNTKKPITLGGFFSPKDYSIARQELSRDIQKTQASISREYRAWKKIFPTPKIDSSIFHNGLIEYFGPPDAKTIIVAMGSVCGTIKETIKGSPDIALLKILSFRPFPVNSLKRFINNNCNLIILEKSAPSSAFGSLYTELLASLSQFKGTASNHIVGLGGQDISEKLITKIINFKKGTKLKFWQ